ncbi:MAG: hypothetical protein EBT26_05445 [Microbacteriaceae bacterium]|nr:hypothetical protein [Microbacteriaceae bacterium]
MLPEYDKTPPIFWHINLKKTLEIMWENLLIITPEFYQKSFMFDRCVESEKDFIRDFFDKKDVYSYVVDEIDSVLGPVSRMVLIARPERFRTYK